MLFFWLVTDAEGSLGGDCDMLLMQSEPEIEVNNICLSWKAMHR